MGVIARVKAAALAFTGKGGGVASVVGSKSLPPTRNQGEILEAFNNMPWVRANLGRIGHGVGQVQWKLVAMKGTKPGEGRYVQNKALQHAPAAIRRKALAHSTEVDEADAITDHPLLDLLREPNPIMHGADFMGLCQIYLDSVGDCFIVIDRSNTGQKAAGSGRGMPGGLYPMVPTWVKETPTGARPLFKIEIGALRLEPPMTEVLWRRVFNPANPYMRGTGLINALADELDAGENASKLVNFHYYNRGRPDVLIGLPNWRSEEITKFADEWNASLRGMSNVGKSHFVNTEPKVQVFTQDFETLQLTQQQTFIRDTVRQVLGNPPEILGITDASSRDRTDAADDAFNRYQIDPRLEGWRAFLQRHLVPEYDDRLILDYESPVQADQNFSLSVASRVPHVLRVNEWRKLAHQPPLPDGEGGNLFLVPPGLFGFESLTALKESDLKAALELQRGGGNVGGGMLPEATTSGGPNAGATGEGGVGAPTAPQAKPTRRKPNAEPTQGEKPQTPAQMAPNQGKKVAALVAYARASLAPEIQKRALAALYADPSE